MWKRCPPQLEQGNSADWQMNRATRGGVGGDDDDDQWYHFDR